MLIKISKTIFKKSIMRIKIPMPRFFDIIGGIYPEEY
jgi:hypothetical protein